MRWDGRMRRAVVPAVAAAVAVVATVVVVAVVRSDRTLAVPVCATDPVSNVPISPAPEAAPSPGGTKLPVIIPVRVRMVSFNRSPPG